MRDFAGEAFWTVAGKPGARQGPEFRQDVVLNEGYVLDLAVESRHKTKLRFGASVCLRGGQSVHAWRIVCAMEAHLALVKHFLCDFIFQRLGRLLLLQDLILTQRQEAFEEVLPDRESENELLPRETGSVKEDG